MKIACAALGGLLLTWTYWIGPPAGLLLLVLAFSDELSKLALGVYLGLAGERLLRDLRRNPHRRASGFMVLLTQERPGLRTEN